MPLTRSILTLTFAAAIVAPAHAAPPTFGTQGRQTFAAKPLPRTAGGIAPKPVQNVAPRLNPPQSFGGFKPAVPTVKPGIPVVKPSVPAFKPRPMSPIVVKPAHPVIRPNVPVFKPTTPTITVRPPAAVPKPKQDRDFVLKDGRGPIAIPGVGAAQPGSSPIHIDPALDANGNGRIDVFEPGNLPVLDVGGNAAGNNGNANPPVVGNANANGPTAWDWVAIGLSAAALADSLAHRHDGYYVNDGVVIDRPLVQTVPYTETVPLTETVTETIIIHEEPLMVREQPLAEPLPQLRVGSAFELPAKGLGTTRGRVAVKIGAVILECPVAAWSDAGFSATVAPVTLDAATKADLIVALADGTVAAKIPVELLPAVGAAVASTK